GRRHARRSPKGGGGAKATAPAGRAAAPVTTPRRMLLALALTGAAWGAHVFGRALPTWGAVLVWAGLAWPIALGLARRRRIRCAAFRAAYLLPTGRLGTVFRG